MTPRLTSKFWIDALRARLDAANIPVYIRARGDATAGAIVLKIDEMNGRAQSYTRGHDADGDTIWHPLHHGTDAEVEAALQRQMSFDPDLWVIEVEDRTGRRLFTDDLLPR